MNVPGAVQMGAVLTIAGVLAAKVAAQRRRGLRSVHVRGPRERLLFGALFAWVGSVALHGSELAPGLFEPRLVDSGAARLAGAALTLAAPVLFAVAFVHMGRAWRIGIDRAVPEELVTSGVFARSRNPIYLAIDLLALGALALSPSPWFLVTSPLVLLGVHARIRAEERFLHARHGATFERYRATTARYWGRRRRGGREIGSSAKAPSTSRHERSSAPPRGGTPTIRQE